MCIRAFQLAIAWPVVIEVMARVEPKRGISALLYMKLDSSRNKATLSY